MPFERIKKPQIPPRLEPEKPKLTGTHKPIVQRELTPEQKARNELQHQKQLEAFDVRQQEQKIQRKPRAIQRAIKEFQATNKARIDREAKIEIQRLTDIQAKQQAFFSSFVKPAVQRATFEQVKTSGMKTSETRATYQAAIVPEMVQRLVNDQMTVQAQASRATQKPNALNTRTDWFNTELPLLRARHNNPDKPEFDTKNVFEPSDTRAKDLGITYMRQRLSSGLTPKDAASAIVNIQRSRDRNNALKGLLSAIRPQDSDHSRIQRLVAEKEQNLELQRQALFQDDAIQARAFQLAKDEANPTKPNSGISERINAKRGAGEALSMNVRQQLEAGLNTDLSRVRVHTDAEADFLSKSIHAKAFTTGNDIFFSSGSYNPNTKSGYELIAHEVTHTVQQASGQVSPGIDASSSLESAAQNKGAELAAKFEPNAKLNFQPDSHPKAPLTSDSNAMQRSSLALQREVKNQKLDVTKLNGGQKLFEAIKHAPMGESVKQQLLNAISPESLGLFALVFGAGAIAQATPVGWAADLIIAGLLAFGFWSVGSIIVDVIKDFAAFSSTALSAKSEADLNLAGYYFSNAVAKIGVTVVIAMIAHTAAKGMNAKMKASAAQRKAVSAQQIQAKLNAQKPSGSSSQPNTPASTLVASGVLSQEFIKAFKSEPVAQKAVVTYSTFPNWAEIQPIIGKAMSSSSVPKGYLYATIEGKEYYYLPGADKTKVPVVESNAKGNAYLPSKPSYRIADKNRYDRNFGQKTITAVNGSEIHHMIPDNVWRSEPLLQHLLAKGWANMDEKANLIELAKTQSALDDVRKANLNTNLSDVIHSSGHKLYDELVKSTLEEAINRMRNSAGKADWEKFTKDEMLKVLQRTLNQLRNLFMNEPDQLPKKKDGTLGFLPQQESDTV